MDVLKPWKVVEPGSRNGLSFLSLCQAARKRLSAFNLAATPNYRHSNRRFSR
jgi:hypothetical protein